MDFFVSGSASSRSRSRKQRKVVTPITLCLLASAMLILIGYFIAHRPGSVNSVEHDQLSEQNSDQTQMTLSDAFFATRLRTYDEVRNGENLSSSLKRMGVSALDADKFLRALGGEINMRTIKPGDVLMVESSAESIQLRTLSKAEGVNILTPQAVEVFSKDEHGLAFSVKASFLNPSSEKNVQVKVNKTNVYKEHALINGIVSNSVYGAIVAGGGDAQLVNAFSDIFAGQFDFFRESREGDGYQMIVERNVADGRFIGYNRVLAAEYSNGNRTLRAYHFQSSDSQVSGFFDEEGRSLRTAFLKAPLKLANISSPFNNRRYHPVQKRFKPHNGVDYGANLGTPVMAVAGGIIINAGFSPFNGNWVRIKHLNGYETEYLHANKLAPGVRVGARVSQGQVICFVGKTGLATGYHLHFGMKKDGKYVDPTQQRFARSAGVPSKYMKEFASSIEAMAIALNRQSPGKANVVAMINKSNL